MRQLRQPHAALADLCDGFFDDAEWVSRCPRIAAADLDEPFRTLLAHREHMTERLAAYYGKPVELRVLREQRDPGEYARKILLTLRGEPTRVELGVVRLNLAFVTRAVRDEILASRAPLGDILIRHGVFRRVSPRWYFSFPPDTPAARELGGQPAFGRVGTIYCDEEPAIDLLEVVTAAGPR
ncbi:MAG: hypothetical protein LC135_01570 [Phycisphaerae bacterium]|jgi:hypothetical protein|nr:hypothetical protein [Phycisphaerae bacterium]MCZ2398541.1 hypothetical protein [Phycisphaerae bacterium]NUQ50295.1 hypothetical protein [Phycisphaerae bacterium]